MLVYYKLLFKNKTLYSNEKGCNILYNKGGKDTKFRCNFTLDYLLSFLYFCRLIT